MRRFAIAIATALLIPAATASAADPATGTLSGDSPSVAWKGTLVHPYVHHNVFNYEPAGTLPCEAPACDTFTLDVKQSADLTITVQSEDTPDMSMRIQNPAGEWVYVGGWADTAKPTTYKLKKAPTGTYTINVVGRMFGSTNPTAVEDTFDYAGVATLAVAAPAPAMAPVVATPAPAPAPAAPAQPAARKKPSCKARARKIKNAKKRKAALKRCARARKR